MEPNLVRVWNELLNVTVVEAPSSPAEKVMQGFDRRCLVAPGMSGSGSGETLTQRILVGVRDLAPVSRVAEVVQGVLETEYETKTVVHREDSVIVEIVGSRKKC